MFQLLISFIPLPLVLLYFISNKKYNNINWDIRTGRRCLECKEEIENIDKEDFRLCVKCNRDRKLNKLVNWKIDTYNIKKILMLDKTWNILIVILIISIFGGTVLSLFGIKYTYLISPSVTFLFWILMFIKRELTSDV